MERWELTLSGFMLVAAGVCLIFWAIKRRLAWERGEDSPPARPSFRISPAPGRTRLAVGIALVFVGCLLLAPFFAAL